MVRSATQVDVCGILVMEGNVQVTLNPFTSNPNVAISEDQIQVRYVCNLEQSNTSQNVDFEDYCALGSPVITSGRCYWEVDVLEKHTWVLR
ncbi:TRIM5, partial [Cervus elaphus hippelaphus]